MLNKKNILSFLKWALVVFFLLLIALDIPHTRRSSYTQNRIIVLISLTIILLYKNRYTWIIGIILCAYAWYYLIAVAGKYSQYVAFDLTARLKYIFHTSNRTITGAIIYCFPFYFYFISFVIFLTPMGRRWYGISFKKQPKISPLS